MLNRLRTSPLTSAASTKLSSYCPSSSSGFLKQRGSSSSGCSRASMYQRAGSSVPTCSRTHRGEDRRRLQAGAALPAGDRGNVVGEAISGVKAITPERTAAVLREGAQRARAVAAVEVRSGGGGSRCARCGRRGEAAGVAGLKISRPYAGTSTSPLCAGRTMFKEDTSGWRGRCSTSGHEGNRTP